MQEVSAVSRTAISVGVETEIVGVNWRFIRMSKLNP